MTVRSKKEMYELYEAGRFGNKLETWPSLEAFYRDHVTKNVVMRYMGKAGGGWIQYDLPSCRVRQVADEWAREGADTALIALNESAPDHLLLVQGEVARSTSYLSLRYSTAKMPMRRALTNHPAHAEGLTALLTLRRSMDPSSFDDLMDLLDAYEDAVVEFSTWEAEVGIFRNRNTVFWEVRNY